MQSSLPENFPLLVRAVAFALRASLRVLASHASGAGRRKKEQKETHQKKMPLDLSTVVVYSVAAAAAYYAYSMYSDRKKRRRHSLRGLKILVTGGGSGIGAELCHRLAVREGALVFAVDVDSEGLKRTADRIERAGGRCSCFPCNVADKKQMSSLVEMIESRAEAPIDVLVNNAGICVPKTFEESTDDELERTFHVNVFAHFYAIRAVLPSMRARPEGGHIVQIGSTMDSLACARLAAYTASKWAVAGFTESLREELVDTNVRLTLVRPWIVSTPMFDKVSCSNWLSFTSDAVVQGSFLDAFLD